MKRRFNVNLDDSTFTKERAHPQFESLFKKGQTSETSSIKPSSEHLSYAQFIVQSKSNAAAALPREGPSNLPTTEDAAETNLNQKEAASASCAPGGHQRVQEMEKDGFTKLSEAPPENSTKHNDGTCSDPNHPQGPKPVGCGSSIVVSPRQRGNPILKYVRSVPWEFGDVVPDYVLGQTTCALFLSLRYHNLNPNYIHDRLKHLGQSFTLRVLLVQVDVKDPHHALRELAQICVKADCTLILAWSPEEAGRYLETYKSYEKKPADALKEQVERDYLSKVTDCLTTVKSINKTDAITLLSTFSSVEGITNASKEDLVLCPGLGPQKARRLYDVLHKPFLKSKNT